MSDLLDLVRKTLSEKQAKNIVTIDMQAVSPFTDYFVIATAGSLRQANALCEYVEDAAFKHGYDVRMSEGERESDWMLVDLNDVVVHIFTEDARRMYRLEALWADQPQEMYEDEENAVV